MFANAIQVVKEAFENGIRPKEDINVWQWADRFRILSVKTSSEPGKFRTDRVPYMREIMCELSHQSPTQIVVFKKAAQVGATEAGNNWIGYTIDQDPCTMMVVWPSLGDVKKNSKLRVDPLIEKTPCLAAKVGNGKAKDKGNTALFKDFDDGALILTGANAPGGLRSVPAKKSFMDEIDGYPDDAGGEGDPIALVAARSRTFSKRKSFRVSTPTYAGKSKIHKQFMMSDQRFYYVPCPHCNERQILGHENHEDPFSTFDHLHYETQTTDAGEEVVTDAWISCKKCGEIIEEHHKPKMLRDGEWIKHNPQSNVAGFHLHGLYSPLGWYSWKQICQDYVDAKRSGDPEDMKTFVNTGLGECYEDKGERPAEDKLFSRREAYDIGMVPRGVVFLTCAVDVQKDRLEAEVHGWGRGREKWVIERKFIMGDPEDDETWENLEEYITGTFPHVDGYEIPIRTCAIDSGHQAQKVYNFCRKFDPKRVFPIKGRQEMTVMVGTPKGVDVKVSGKTIKNGVKLWTIGTNLIKSEIYGDLKKDEPQDLLEGFPPGFTHFPMLDKEYFLQLVAEERVISKNKKGYPVVEWRKKRDRNETLDLHVYNRAAAHIFGIDRFKEAHWKKLESNIMVVKNLKRPENKTVKKETRPKAKKKKSSFW